MNEVLIVQMLIAAVGFFNAKMMIDGTMSGLIGEHSPEQRERTKKQGWVLVGVCSVLTASIVVQLVWY